MITFTLQIASLDNADIDAALIAALHKRGYAVAARAPGALLSTEGESPSAFCRRLGLHPGAFKRTWMKPGRPAVDFNSGPTGRLIRLLATPELEAFYLQHKINSQLS